MKICKCGKSHEKPGKFCSHSCANSRVQTKEINEKRSKTLKVILGDPERRKANSEKTKEYWTRVKAGKEFRKYRVGKPIEDVLSGKVECRCDYTFKLRLLKEGILENKCSTPGCNVGPLWMGKPVTCELHHKDGNDKNQRRENLEMLCPNCHSQTENHRAKKTSL